MKKSSLLVLGAMSALALSSCTFPWSPAPSKGTPKYEKAIQDVAAWVFEEKAEKGSNYFDASELFTSFEEGQAYFTLWYDEPDPASEAEDPYLDLFETWVLLTTLDSEEYKGPLAGYSVRSEAEYDSDYEMYHASFDSPDYKVSVEFAGYVDMFSEGDDYLYIVVLGYECPYHKGWPSKADFKKEIGVNQDLPKLDGEFESEWFYNDQYNGIVIDVPGYDSEDAEAYANKLDAAGWTVEFAEDTYYAYDEGENFLIQFFAYDDAAETEEDDSELIILACNFKDIIGYKGFPDAKFLKDNLGVDTAVPAPVVNDGTGNVDYVSYYLYEPAEGYYVQDVRVTFDIAISDGYALQLDEAGWNVEEGWIGFSAYDEDKTVYLQWYDDSEQSSVLYIYNYEDKFGKLGFPSQSEIKAKLGVDVAVPVPAAAESAEFRYQFVEDEDYGDYFYVATEEANCADEYAAELEALGWIVEVEEGDYGDVTYYATNAEGTIEIQFYDYTIYEFMDYYCTEIYIYLPAVDAAE